jgi:hypothetical protein
MLQMLFLRLLRDADGLAFVAERHLFLFLGRTLRDPEQRRRRSHSQDAE